MKGAKALVLGCGDVGSAVAHRLRGAAACVVLCDLARPAHARRGMAYTNALFEGTAQLEGVTGRLVPDVAAIRSCWEGGQDIPIVTIPEEELLREIRFDVAVEATMRRHRTPPDIRGFATTTVGLGPGFMPGVNCHVAVETQWGSSMGAVVRDHATATLAGGPNLLEGVGRERFVAAPVSGRWRSQAVIGQPVQAGDVMGHIGDCVVRAPIDGSLRGVSHDDVDVREGQKLLEVDPRSTPQIQGLGERPLAIARGVLLALGWEPGRETAQPRA
jgi:xanthine dehydrogenase accessory factor